MGAERARKSWATKRGRRLVFGAAVVLSLFVIFSLGVAPRAAETKHVAAKDNFFEPADLTINVGDTVVWTNEGRNDHTVEDETLRPGESYSLTFTKPGNYGYHCHLHHDDNMEGRIRVVGSAPEEPSPSPDPPDVSSHDRRLSLSLSRHLTAQGSVTVIGRFPLCRQRVPVRIERRRGNRWVVVRTAKTNSAARYSIGLPDRPGTYRAVALPMRRSQNDLCERALSPSRRHAH